MTASSMHDRGSRVGKTAEDPGAGLHADLVVDRPNFRLSVRLSIRRGEVVALLGPNGAGKTTALRALAGLTPVAAGRVSLDGEVIDDPAKGFSVPTRDRAVGVVFQDYLLFPHLSSVDNVAFGLRCRGMGRSAARLQAMQWLERVQLADRAQAKPRELSGGQAQRVALARALAPAPRLLLLDEPLAALDATTRLQLRADLRHHLHDFAGCSLVVTHDPLDAMVLADRLVVVEDGSIVQTGRPADVARHPRTEYVANLVGLNLHRGMSDGTHVRLSGGGELTVAHPVVGDVFVAFAPGAVALHRHRPEGSPRNVWRAVVSGVQLHGDRVRVALDGQLPAVADITPAGLAELQLVPGTTVWAAVKATETYAYPS